MMTFSHMFWVYHHKIHHFCILPFWCICVTHRNMFNLPNTIDCCPYIVLLICHNIGLIGTKMCMRYILLAVSHRIDHWYMLILFSDTYSVSMSRFHHVHMYPWCWYMYFCQECKFVWVDKYFSNVKCHYWT